MKLVRWVWVGIGAALLVLPMLPLPDWVGASDEGPLWAPHVASWAIGLGAIALIAVLSGRIFAHLGAPRLRVPGVVGTGFPAILALLLASAAALTTVAAFASNPHLIDEIAQLFQARVFASGRLAAPVPNPPEFFLLTQTLLTDHGWVSQYPPVHAILLALGMLAHAEWLVNPVLGGLGVLLVFYMARGLYGPKTAAAAALLWAVSAWVMFMSATYMNHVTATTLAMVAWAAILGPKNVGVRHYLVAGLAIAGVTATRPLDGVAAALPLIAWIVLRRRWSATAWMVAGGLPVLLGWFYFNQKFFGGPLTLGYSALYGASHSLGFGTDPYGAPFTPLTALSNLAVAIRRLHIHLFEWPIPALLPFAVWAIAARHRHASDKLLAVGVIAIPLLYFFYWHSGFHPGPRFYYAMVPFVVIGTARAWWWGWRLARRRRSPWLRWNAAVVGAAVAVVVWGWVGVVPARFDLYRNFLSTMKLHPERSLAQAGVRRALVLVPAGWGTRTIVSLWALGAPPGLVEEAYLRVDTCDLYQLMRAARSDRLASEDVTLELEAMIRATPNPARTLDNAPDPSVRLRSRSRLPQECEVELRRDFEGFSLYGAFGWRNAVTLDSGILFARDLYERNGELLARYPGWEVWRLAPPKGEPEKLPVLTKIRTGSASAWSSTVDELVSFGGSI